MDKIPKSGKIATGKREVVPIGTASVIHQISIQAITPIVFEAMGSRPGMGKKQSIKKTNGPNIRESVLFFSIKPNVSD